MQLAILGAIFLLENGFLILHILCMISQNVHLLIMNLIARSTRGLIICTSNIDGNLPLATSQGRVLLSLFSSFCILHFLICFTRVGDFFFKRIFFYFNKVGIRSTYILFSLDETLLILLMRLYWTHCCNIDS